MNSVATCGGVRKDFTEKGVIENTKLNQITYEAFFTQFLASDVPVPGSAPVLAHDGREGNDWWDKV